MLLANKYTLATAFANKENRPIFIQNEHQNQQLTPAPPFLPQ
jgi:hypothetical protein